MNNNNTHICVAITEKKISSRQLKPLWTKARNFKGSKLSQAEWTLTRVQISNDAHIADVTIFQGCVLKFTPRNKIMRLIDQSGRRIFISDWSIERDFISRNKFWNIIQKFKKGVILLKKKIVLYKNDNKKELIFTDIILLLSLLQTIEKTFRSSLLNDFSNLTSS